MNALLLGLLAWLCLRARRGRSLERALAAPERPEPELAGLADLLSAAVSSGASVPRALEVVGRSVGGDGGHALARAGERLAAGRAWGLAWQGCPERLAPLERALGDAWHAGAAPVPVLRHLAARERRRRREAAREAAARLGVRLVLPLGLCLLPAFALLGIVPLVLSLGSQLLGR